MYIDGLHADFAETGRLVAFCDINQTRMDHYNRLIAERYDGEAVPTFQPGEFEKMIKTTRPDVVIVTSLDRTHHRYITGAMRAGCDVVTEKPMTIDLAKCRDIVDAIADTGRRLAVTFNYRYAPRNSRVKELLLDEVIGDVKSVHFEWLLDTSHGADYFRRWHRDKRNSGGLMVHKATHHFDLMNWWLNAHPRTVFGIGKLCFYGRANAEERGVQSFYSRGTGSAVAAGDPFALDLHDGILEDLYLKAESEDGYIRDQSVFGDGISIEDDMSVLVGYDSDAVMTYHLTAYSPWEGYNVAFNGTKGRLEYHVQESSYVSGASGDLNAPDVRRQMRHTQDANVRIVVRPHWAPPYEVEVEQVEGGGHGGGDIRMMADIFRGAGDDPLGRAADHVAGAWSILTGIAANESFRLGQPVDVNRLIRDAGIIGL